MEGKIVDLTIIFLMSFLVESLTEAIFGTVFQKVEKLNRYSWALMYIAMIFGVIGAFVYHFDLISIIAREFGGEIPVTYFGIVLTGLSIGRGANFIHDLFGKFFGKG